MHNKIKHIKNYNKNIITWEELLMNFSNCVVNNKLIKVRNPGFFISHNADEIEKIKPIMKKLKVNTAHLYMNIAISIQGLGKHKDSMDVYFLQCQGKTKWIIEEKNVYILEPGDLLFVPKNVWHEVIPLTPRAGISMSKE